MDESFRVVSLFDLAKEVTNEVAKVGRILIPYGIILPGLG